MYSLMNPLCWSRSTLINGHEQIPLFSQCCLDKLQFHLTLDSNFNSFHRTTVNTSLGIQWLNCKARSVSRLPPRAHPAPPPPPHPTPTLIPTPSYFKSQFVLSRLHSLHLQSKVKPDILGTVCCGSTLKNKHLFVFYMILLYFIEIIRYIIWYLYFKKTDCCYTFQL